MEIEIAPIMFAYATFFSLVEIAGVFCLVRLLMMLLDKKRKVKRGCIAFADVYILGFSGVGNISTVASFGRRRWMDIVFRNNSLGCRNPYRDVVLE